MLFGDIPHHVHVDTTSNITLHICVAITRLSRFSSQHFALSAFNLKSTSIAVTLCCLSQEHSWDIVSRMC